jgi:hypothetical protein
MPKIARVTLPVIEHHMANLENARASEREIPARTPKGGISHAKMANG